MNKTGNSLSNGLASWLPAGTSLFLFVGYVAIVALFRRSGLFDFTYHAIVLVLMGFAMAAHTPFREIATAMLATMLIASVLSYLFGEGARDRRAQARRKYSTHTAVLPRATGASSVVK